MVAINVPSSVQGVLDKVQENKKEVLIGAGVATAALGAALLYTRAKNAVPKSGPYPPGTLPEGAYDAVIVGAGPSGSVCAYYLAKAGLKVALLDKEKFPRDKVRWIARCVAGCVCVRLVSLGGWG